jgi:hypothetical protein
VEQRKTATKFAVIALIVPPRVEDFCRGQDKIAVILAQKQQEQQE